MMTCADETKENLRQARSAPMERQSVRPCRVLSIAYTRA